MMWLGKKIYALCFLILTNLIGYSQSWEYSYSHIEKQDGLPSDNIYFLCNDKNGAIWIGTDAGLCKFDGVRFKTYTSKDGLPGDDVFELFCDSKNRIWITTMGNEISYLENDKIHTRKNDSILSRVVIPNGVSRILEGEDTTIWIVAYPFILNKFMKNGNVVANSCSESLGVCFRSLVYPKGVFFITHIESVIHEYSTKELKELNLMPKLKIRDLHILNDSSFVYSNNENKVFKIYKDPTQFNFYSKHNVFSLFSDDEFVWQLTKNGIKRFNKSDLNSERMFLPNYSVSNYLNDVYGNSWISTFNNGLFKINSMQIRNFKPNNTEPSNSIYSLLKEKNKIIIGNNNGQMTLLKNSKDSYCKQIKIEKNSLLSYRLLKLIEKNGVVYVCTDVGVYTFNIFSNKFGNILEDNVSCKNCYFLNDTMIILTNNYVAYYLNNRICKKFHIWERSYSFTPYLNQNLFGSENALYYQKDSLIPYPLDQPFRHRIMDMKVDDSLLVVATNEQGIFFIKGNKVLDNINLDKGLNSNSCSKILLYKGEIIVGTNNGIALYNRTNGEIRKIMESDGLASNNVHDIAVDQDTLYAGTDKGLSVIPISSIKSQKSFTFFVNPIIEEKDTIWDITESIHSRTNHAIALTLNALTLGVKGGVNFFYRIRERDSVFSTTIDPNIKLTFDKPGVYTFESYGVDVNSLKSVTSLLTIIVVPYWWQTSLFKWICVVAGLFVIFFVIFLIVRYVRKLEQIKNARQNRIWKLELDAWKANINPHFLYNSFNTIQSLFSSNKFQIANEFIANFSDVLRRTIDNSGLLMNPSKDEITYLNQYLELERVKRSGRLNYIIDCDDEPDSYGMIPSLILQPIIENSIKHGPKKPNICLIEISFSKENQTILITVKDNGPGFPDSSKGFANSKGLQLVRDKIRIVEQITGKLIEFNIENVYSENHQCLGVLATFEMPLFVVEDYEGRS